MVVSLGDGEGCNWKQLQVTGDFLCLNLGGDFVDVGFIIILGTVQMHVTHYVCVYVSHKIIL